MTDSTVVTCARGWIGTRFLHQGRLKRTQHHAGGVDCLGLLIGVSRELDLRDAQGKPLWELDETRYSYQPDTDYLRRKLDDALVPQPIHALCAGQVALLSIDGSPQHLGIISESAGQAGIIHAYAQARRVVEHIFDPFWQAQLICLYQLPNQQ